MRIRKRPPQVTPCSPDLSSALPAHVQPTLVRGKDGRVAAGGQRGGWEGERLQRHGDLPPPALEPPRSPSDLQLHPMMEETASPGHGSDPAGHGSSRKLQEGPVDAAHKTWKQKIDAVNSGNSPSFGAISQWWEEMSTFSARWQDNQDAVGSREKGMVAAETTTASTATSSNTDDDVMVVVKKEEEDLDHGLTANGDGKSRRKRRRIPAVLMEGSRCSRVNGRGWRCWQQTLVGYSLCEHHLGKGRLRSMNSVRTKGSSKSYVEEDDHVASPQGDDKTGQLRSTGE